MTTTPRMPTVEISARIALTATPSAPSFSPRPTQREAAMAAASVTRTSSRARLRSGADIGAQPSEITGLLPHRAKQVEQLLRQVERLEQRVDVDRRPLSHRATLRRELGQRGATVGRVRSASHEALVL